MFPPLKWPCYSDKLESQVGAVCVFCTRHCVPDWKPNCVGSGPKEGACWGGRGAAWVLTPKPAHFQKHLPSAVGRRGVVLKAPHRATHSQSTRGPQPCAFWFPGRVPHQQSPCLPAPPPHLPELQGGTRVGERAVGGNNDQSWKFLDSLVGLPVDSPGTS